MDATWRGSITNKPTARAGAAFLHPEYGAVQELNSEEAAVKQVGEQQIQNDLVEILSRLVGVEAAKIKASDRLREDLGLDSLQSMELLSRISDKYELNLEVEDVMDVKTVGDVVKELQRFMSAGK